MGPALLFFWRRKKRNTQSKAPGMKGITMSKPSIPGVAAVGTKLSRRLARARRLWRLVVGVSLLGALCWVHPVHAQFAITELMAANNVTLNDENGDNSDWIEIHNEGAVTASLAGWFLTDTTNLLTEWQFPATNLPPNGYLVVFASSKNRRVPGAPLHTNFKLSAGGEYLALVAPDGTNVVSQFAPVFPPQVADVSYGMVRNTDRRAGIEQRD